MKQTMIMVGLTQNAFWLWRDNSKKFGSSQLIIDKNKDMNSGGELSNLFILPFNLKLKVQKILGTLFGC